MHFNRVRKYFNPPQYFNREYYREATEKFVERYSMLRDVLSIYLFGQVSVEGISDLDFLVILREPLTETLNRKFSVMTFDKDLRYIFNNTQPFLMNEEIYRNFWKIFPTHNLKRVYGKGITQLGSDENRKKHYNLLILIDVCISFYPKIFLKQLFSRKLNVRYSLLTLNALKFPLEMFMDICNYKGDSWIEFIGQVKELRERWFKMSDGERHQILIRALKKAGLVSLDLIFKLHDYIKQNMWEYSQTVSNKTNFKLKSLDIHFISTFDKNMVLDLIINKFKRTGNWYTYVPLTFYFPLFVYSMEEGVISEHIRGCLHDEGDYFTMKDDRIYLSMKDRINFMNKHAEFYECNMIEIDMVHSYYGYDPLKAKRMSFFSYTLIKTIFYNITSKWR